MSWRYELDDDAERTRALLRYGPMRAPGHLRRLQPFFFVAGCGIASLSFDPDVNVPMALAMSSVCCAVLVVDAAFPWRRFPRHVQRIPPIVALLAIAAFMYSDGGLNSPVLGAIVMPAIWMTMYETLDALVVTLGLTFVLLLTEVWVDFHADSLLRSVILMALMAAVLPAGWRIVDLNRQAILALAEVANTDPLTGLSNRRGFDRRMHDPSVDDRRPLGLVYLDLNRFKEINDRLGHDAGDALLVAVGARIAAAVREDDLCARLGGDEFVVACRGDDSDLLSVADRVRHAIGDEPFIIGEVAIEVSAAVGVSHVSAEVLDLPALLAEADAAMYAAKPQRPR